MRLLYKNQLELKRDFSIEYRELMEQVNKNNRQFVTLPYNAAQALLEHGKKSGHEPVSRHTANLPSTAVALSHPESAKYGDFSGFSEYLERRFGNNLEALKQARFSAEIVLAFRYALPGLETKK